MKHRVIMACVLVAAAVSAACGSNPAEPSGESATLNGSIVSGSGSASSASVASGPSGSIAAAPNVPPGLEVAVAGTSIRASVDGAGQFQLKNVPPGLADLRFSAPGIAVALAVADVKAGEVVTIEVSLTSSSATLESDRRVHGRQEQLEGRVESLPPTTAAATFMAAGRTVTTDVNTKFFKQGQPAVFADLVLGYRVHVKGQTNATGLLANTVDIQNTNTDTGLNLNGTVSGFSGTSAAFQFTVNNQLVKGDAATEFFGNSAFADLANGARVTVKGSQRDGFAYATRIHVGN